MDKAEAYKELVEKRKACGFCKGLSNPAAFCNGKLDSNEIGPWSLWQGHIDAQILVVGQDWGDEEYFKKGAGRDRPSGNPTNENLRKLLAILGIEIKGPQEEQEQIIFLTNLILCLKKGGLQAPVRSEWFSNCGRHFFKPLVDIIKPKVVIALGRKVTETILDLYGESCDKSPPYSAIMKQYFAFELDTGPILFPVYHCGAWGVNHNRKWPEQEEDWRKIGERLEDVISEDYMPQDRESGARAVEYGLQTARKIAEKLGAEKIGGARSNEYRLNNKNIVIKCARIATTSVGLAYRMLERLDAILGSFENENGTYDIYEMKPDTYRDYMRPTRSSGPSAGRVGIVRKSMFLEKGVFMTNVDISRC